MVLNDMIKKPAYLFDTTAFFLKSSKGAEAPSFVIVSTGFASRAGRLQSKLSLHFSLAVSTAYKRKVQTREK